MMYQNTILAKGQFNVGVNKKKREEGDREGGGRGEGRERGWRERVKAWTLGCCSSSIHQTDEMQLRADTVDIIFGLMAFNVTL